MSSPTLNEVLKITKNWPRFEDVNKIQASYRFKTLRETKEILVYENGIYTNGGEITIEQECENTIHGNTNHKTNEVKSTIRRRTYIGKNKKFDNYDNLICVKNGIFNLDTNELIPHSSKYLFRIQLPIIYDKSATCEQFKEYLDQCFPDEKNKTSFLESFASTLLPNAHLEKMFMNVGSGANGKSTGLKIIDHFLGPENVSNISIHDMSTDKFALAGLDCKLANIYADISSKEIRELGPIKAIISGDPIEVQRKNQNRFKMTNKAKLIFSCNELPELGEDSHAVYRRLVVIEWNQQFSHDDPKHKINSNLLNELTTENELSGILNLLLPYVQKIRETGKITYDENTSNLRRIWAQKADPIGTFLDSCVEQDFETKTSKVSIFQAFCKWCKENKITPKKEKAFNSKVSQKFGIQATVGRLENKPTRLWEGIKILSV